MLCDNIPQHIHTVVELVIAGNPHIISYQVLCMHHRMDFIEPSPCRNLSNYPLALMWLPITSETSVTVVNVLPLDSAMIRLNSKISALVITQ